MDSVGRVPIPSDTVATIVCPAEFVVDKTDTAIFEFGEFEPAEFDDPPTEVTVLGGLAALLELAALGFLPLPF